mgnify:CR=1 FL=1
MHSRWRVSDQVEGQLVAITDKNKDSNFTTLKRTLQRFQSERLNRTYADLKADPQYTAIGDFFFNRLYAPQDFAFRDTSIKNLQHILEGRIYRPITSAMLKVVKLHELSDDLDERMVAKMIEAGIGTELSLDQYRMVYRQLDNYDQRVYQINLTIDVIHVFHGLSQKWIVAASLKTVTVAAHLLKVGKILDFINEGYLAFRQIKSIDYFVNTIARKEMAWHDKLWQETKTDM